MTSVSYRIDTSPQYLQYEIDKLLRLEQKIRGLEEQIVKPILLDGANLIADTYKTYVRRITGNLHSKVEVTQNPIRITSNAHYASYIEKGTRPHIIRPVNKQALRFRSGGKTVFAKQVHHPGTAAQYAMKRAYNDNISMILLKLKQAVTSSLEAYR